MSEKDIDEFLERLPQLIREDPKIKGAILTVLSGIIPTGENLKEILVNMNKGFEWLETLNNKQFDFVSKRFEKLYKYFEGLYKHFERLEKRFDSMEKKLSLLDSNSLQTEQAFKQFVRKAVAYALRGEGIPNVKLVNIVFYDKENTVSKDSHYVKIDGFCEDPPLIVEIAHTLRSPKKIDLFVRKKKFVERLFEKPFHGFFVSNSIELDPETVEKIKTLLKEHNSELISL